MKKIICIGAGVGGLSCVHELVKYLDPKEYEIHVYERNAEVGGQARSALEAKGVENPKGIHSEYPNGNIHSEYCWHVVTSGYENLIGILKEIPTPEGNVSSRLKPIEKYIYARENNTLVEDHDFFMYSINPLRYIKMFYNMRTLTKLKIFDLFKILQIKLLAKTSCEKRLEQYDDVLYVDFTKNLSEEAKKWITDSTSIYLGLKTDTLSTHTILKLMKNINKGKNCEGYKADFYCFDGAINDRWFDPWVKFLQGKNVVFHLSTEVDKVFMVDNQIKGIFAKNSFVECNYVINGCGVETLKKLYETNKFDTLTDISHQIQTQVLYFIDKKLDLPPTFIILPDTIFQIMIRVEGGLWGDKRLKSFVPEGCYDILSAGIGIWYKKGLNGKTALECTIEELKTEVWEQILRSKILFEYVKTCDGFTFAQTNVIHSSVWPSYKFESIKREIDTYEPKFSNSVGCLKLRPNTVDDQIKNLIHSTAYVNTDVCIFNMESGAEAGVKASREILRKENILYSFDVFERYTQNILQKCDEFLYKKGFPHVAVVGGIVLTTILSGFFYFL